MNAVNQIEMAGTALAVAQARKFPFLIVLCARQMCGPIAEFTIDHAATFSEAGEKMYEHFSSVNFYVDNDFNEPPQIGNKVPGLCYFCDQSFGECVFSIVVKRRDGE